MHAEERLQARDMLNEEIDIKPDPRRKYSYLCEGGHYCDSPHEMKTCPLAWCGRTLRRVGKGSKGGKAA